MCLQIYYPTHAFLEIVKNSQSVMVNLTMNTRATDTHTTWSPTERLSFFLVFVSQFNAKTQGALLYFAPPQIELFCICQSGAQQHERRDDGDNSLSVSATLRLCVILEETQRRKGAETQRLKTAVYAGVEYNLCLHVLHDVVH